MPLPLNTGTGLNSTKVITNDEFACVWMVFIISLGSNIYSARMSKPLIIYVPTFSAVRAKQGNLSSDFSPFIRDPYEWICNHGLLSVCTLGLLSSPTVWALSIELNLTHWFFLSEIGFSKVHFDTCTNHVLFSLFPIPNKIYSFLRDSRLAHWHIHCCLPLFPPYYFFENQSFIHFNSMWSTLHLKFLWYSCIDSLLPQLEVHQN